jgi:hypothetical protein
MKRFLLIGLIIGLVLSLAGGAGLVYARVRNLDNNVVISLKDNQENRDKDRQVPFRFGPGGMMNGFGNVYGPGGMMNGFGPGGMMGGRGFRNGNAEGLLQDYVISAFAKAVGLTVDEVNTRLIKGETLVQIAQSQGFTGDKLTQLVKDVRKAALDQAVAAGVITQAQADRMLQRMDNSIGQCFGFGMGTLDYPLWDGNKLQP